MGAGTLRAPPAAANCRLLLLLSHTHKGSGITRGPSTRLPMIPVWVKRKDLSLWVYDMKRCSKFHCEFNLHYLIINLIDVILIAVLFIIISLAKSFIRYICLQTFSSTLGLVFFIFNIQFQAPSKPTMHAYLWPSGELCCSFSNCLRENCVGRAFYPFHTYKIQFL